MFEDNTHYSKSNYDSNNRNIINHSKKARRSKKKKNNQTTISRYSIQMLEVQNQN